jgi:hypothetical protein
VPRIYLPNNANERISIIDDLPTLFGPLRVTRVLSKSVKSMKLSSP